MVCYFKRICGINQAEDRVTWPDLLHRHTIALASFREWSVVSARLRIRAQPRNPCRARNSASAWTWCLQRSDWAPEPAPNSGPGARPTNGISIEYEFRIRSNLECFSLKSCNLVLIKILTVFTTRSRRYFREEVFPWFFLFKSQFHALVFHRMKPSSD